LSEGDISEFEKGEEAKIMIVWQINYCRYPTRNRPPEKLDVYQVRGQWMKVQLTNPDSV
jgi:hypothetical protein